MNKNFRDRFAEFFLQWADPNQMTENSGLREIFELHPEVLEFVERRYGLKIDAADRQLSLKDFADQHHLPSAEQLLVDIQSNLASSQVRMLSPKQAQLYLQIHPETRMLDVRENPSEKGRLLKAQRLCPKVLDEILLKWPRNFPIILYCQHGGQSLDAAQFLVDRGFGQVYVLEGGLDAWREAMGGPSVKPQQCV